MTDDDTDLDLDALLPGLHRIDRRLARTAARVSQLGAGDPALDDLVPYLEALGRRLDRTTAGCHQLTRVLQRRGEVERGPDAPHLKRRLPSVVKTLTAPGEGATFLKKAVAAYRAGPTALGRFALAERAAGRLE